MSLVHWQFGDGRRVTADIADGTNLMEAALAHADGFAVTREAVRCQYKWAEYSLRMPHRARL